MSFKSEIYQKDYLLWITPVIILFLIFCVIKRDNRDRESAIMYHNSIRSDTTITLNSSTKGESEKINPADNIFIFFADIKEKESR